MLRTELLTPQLCPLQFTFLQDDLGIPLNYRHMEGFGVHTYTLISREGKVRGSACTPAPACSSLAVWHDCWHVRHRRQRCGIKSSWQLLHMPASNDWHSCSWANSLAVPA